MGAGSAHCRALEQQHEDLTSSEDDLIIIKGRDRLIESDFQSAGDVVL
jgi:hypothetical protein